MTADTEFIYLHGFASGPQSIKASAFKAEFERNHLPLMVPDLEGEDFENLTLTRQAQLIEKCLEQVPSRNIGVIGSSLGGYLAAQIAQRNDKVVALYLMAPAFNFLKRWRERLKTELSEPFENSDLIWVFHFRYNRKMPLKAFFFRDAEKWDAVSLDKALPVRIVHGVHDETVSIEESRRFVKHRPYCRLHELDADHGLISQLNWMMADCLEFFKREGLV